MRAPAHAPCGSLDDGHCPVLGASHSGTPACAGGWTQTASVKSLRPSAHPASQPCFYLHPQKGKLAPCLHTTSGSPQRGFPGRSSKQLHPCADPFTTLLPWPPSVGSAQFFLASIVDMGVTQPRICSRSDAESTKGPLPLASGGSDSAGSRASAPTPPSAGAVCAARTASLKMCTASSTTRPPVLLRRPRAPGRGGTLVAHSTHERQHCERICACDGHVSMLDVRLATQRVVEIWIRLRHDQRRAARAQLLCRVFMRADNVAEGHAIVDSASDNNLAALVIDGVVLDYEVCCRAQDPRHVSKQGGAHRGRLMHRPQLDHASWKRTSQVPYQHGRPGPPGLHISTDAQHLPGREAVHRTRGHTPARGDDRQRP
eukprot:3921937-Prymnesium_polylepis.2